MYKLSDYTVILKESDYIIHNTLYGNMLRITGSMEKENINNIEHILNTREFLDSELGKTLIDLKFVVNHKVNEQNILNFRYLSRVVRTLNIIMIPTRQCNFQCPYCYEEHIDYRMEENTYKNIVSMILKLVEQYKYETVNISWFGGEPTLELNNICCFMRFLKDQLNGCAKVYGQITTNGYLLRRDNLEKLVKVGVCDYQITIDGFDKTHNKTRIMKGGEPTWNRIIQNLHDAKNSNLDFNIIIRTNFTKEILNYAEEWFDYLKTEFLGDSRFKLYFEAVKDLGGKDNTYKFGKGEGEQVSALLELAANRGLYSSTYRMWLQNFGMICYAGKPNSLVIDYDGKIKKCTVILDDEINVVGSVKCNGKYLLNEQNISWWTAYEKSPECLSCKIHPLCYGKKCPACYKKQNYCDNLIQMYYGILRNMNALYKKSNNINN